MSPSSSNGPPKLSQQASELLEIRGSRSNRGEPLELRHKCCCCCCTIQIGNRSCSRLYTECELERENSTLDISRELEDEHSFVADLTPTMLKLTTTMTTMPTTTTIICASSLEAPNMAAGTPLAFSLAGISLVSRERQLKSGRPTF